MRTDTATHAFDNGKVPPVDLVHLSRQTLGNRSLEREVLSLFSTQSVIYVDKLRAATSLDEHKTAVHTLKGSARGIGAWKIAKAAEAVEAIDEATTDLPRDEEAQDRIAILISEVATANAYICTLLNDA